MRPVYLGERLFQPSELAIKYIYRRLSRNRLLFEVTLPYIRDASIAARGKYSCSSSNVLLKRKNNSFHFQTDLLLSSEAERFSRNDYNC